MSIHPHLISAFNKTIQAEPHSPVYTMHKYFARRPWNVFSELISHYTSPKEIVLDPFCGGGVTVVESLKLKRKAIGVDINPTATYVTEMEVRPLNLQLFENALSMMRERVGKEIKSLYLTRCAKCGSDAFADWTEWDEEHRRIIRLKYACPECKFSQERHPTKDDMLLAKRIENGFARSIKRRNLWFPKTPIPHGDKTDSLLSRKVSYFNELFTKRNLLALAILLAEIDRYHDGEAKDFLKFAFSGSLKWASRLSHLRGDIVEGWAMHAYWIYPRSLEINVWNTFERRAVAIIRGKRYSNQHIGNSCRLVREFSDLSNSDGTCLLLNTSSDRLPIPDESIDAIITDPPYGGNVNYAELADYWYIWHSKGKTIEKHDEVIINKAQHKTLHDYERMLHSVLKECHRVLIPGRCLVSTFNSKDLRVVASFVTAASRAGFTLHPDGLQYQNPIRAYATTIHAMQIGAFVGDFIFTFVKEKTTLSQPARRELTDFKANVTALVDGTVRNETTEPQLRERAYRILIPFLANNARANPLACQEAVEFFESKMRKHSLQFRETRMKLAEARRRSFLKKK